MNRKHRGRLAALVGVAAILAGLAAATPAQAAPATAYIHKIYFDSPGSDSGSNSSLNAEYIDIRNGAAVSYKIGGFKVDDRAGHYYSIPSGLTLKPGQVARIHTGKGSNFLSSGGVWHLYWGRAWYVWNNDGDRAHLHRADWSLKDSCTYSGAGSYVYC